MNILKLCLVGRATDNGDGSTSVSFFNDKQELLKDFREYRTEADCSDEDFFNEEDPYENGHFVDDINIEIDLDTGKLYKSFYVSGG